MSITSQQSWKKYKCNANVQAHTQMLKMVSLRGIDSDAFPLLDFNAVVTGNGRVALKLVWNPEPDFDFLLQGAIVTGEHGEGNGDRHPHPNSCKQKSPRSEVGLRDKDLFRPMKICQSPPPSMTIFSGHEIDNKHLRH